jgi:hypothetical protein
MAFYFRSLKVGAVSDKNIILAEIAYYSGKKVNLVEVKSPL